MILEYGDVMERTRGDKDSKIAIPANSMIKGGGRLVMGAGFAKQVADEFPNMPAIAGMALRGNYIEQGIYGFCWIPGTQFALLQTKISPFEGSTLPLLERSIKRMLTIVDKKKYKTGNQFNIKEVAPIPFKHLHIPLPGAGLGGLDREHVLELLEALLPDDDDRFVVWEREKPAE